MTPDHDLIGLIKFLGRDEWKRCLEEVMVGHFGPTMEEFDLEYEEIGDILGDHWAMTLWGCAFEDFLTRVFEPDGRNLVDDYLKRRGRNETAAVKAYMRALRTSVMSLYEVSEISVGQSFLARDLIRGGDPVLVSEKSATRTLKPWDRIAGRIVPQGEKRILAGGILPFSLEASEALLDGLYKAEGKRRPRARSGSRLLIGDETLRELAHLFTAAWLFDVLPRAMGEGEPVLHNSDGEEVVFHQVRFPLAPGITQRDIAPRLDVLGSLRKESARFWNWLGGPAPKRRLANKPANALAWNVTMDDGTTVLGNVEMKGRALVLSVNSATRAARGTALLQAALGDLIRAPLTDIQTVDQICAAPAREPPSSSDVPQEVATELVHAMLDKQYRATLDQPVGMLGDVTPRAAARTPNGREKIAAWLKYLESRSASRADPADPMATYDFRWLWRELGVEELRR